MGNVSASKQEIDKKSLYGVFQKGEDRRARFAERVAHKAADLPLEDDLNIKNTHTGISAKGAMGIAAIAGLPSLAAMGAMMFSGGHSEPQPQQPQGPPSVTYEENADFTIRFWDKDGNPIEVDRISPELKKKFMEAATKQ